MRPRVHMGRGPYVDFRQAYADPKLDQPKPRRRWYMNHRVNAVVWGLIIALSVIGLVGWLWYATPIGLEQAAP